MGQKRPSQRQLLPSWAAANQAGTKGRQGPARQTGRCGGRCRRRAVSVQQAERTGDRRAPAQALAPPQDSAPGLQSHHGRVLLRGGPWARGAPDSLTPSLSGLAGLPRASGLRVQT